jgi:hypothetical protein
MPARLQQRNERRDQIAIEEIDNNHRVEVASVEWQCIYVANNPTDTRRALHRHPHRDLYKIDKNYVVPELGNGCRMTATSASKIADTRPLREHRGALQDPARWRSVRRATFCITSCPIRA